MKQPLYLLNKQKQNRVFRETIIIKSAVFK